MDNHLSNDEFDALEEIGQATKGAKPSACVGRNSKRLVGIKLVAHRKDGTFMLTEKGAEAMFVRKCIATLRTLAANPGSPVDPKVAVFLGRKGYAVSTGTSSVIEITARGRECLADIDLSAKK